LKNSRLWIFLGALVLLAAAFLLLNFHVAVSNTQVESNSGTASIGKELPDAMQQRDKITLAVVGQGPLVRSLQKAIEEEMDAAGLGDIELVPELDPAYDNPVMRIDVGKPGVTWTPFYATSQFSVAAGYGSNGDVTQISGPPHVFSSEEGPSVVMTAEFTVNGRSWGILSRPGYYQILADELARRISETMQNLYLGS
jgi:hypothetical protein